LNYAPLYLAGPIVSFNDFVYQAITILIQLNFSKNSISLNSTAKYCLKWVSMVLLMELMLHLFYVVAIKDSRAWKEFNPIEIYSLGYLNLNLIWLKVIFDLVLVDHYLEIF
jgi:protein-cysteine N-palmitoyltransferase HHAT